MADTPKQSVFVSYSREDLAFATQLVLALRATGFRVAIDHSELQGGEEWRQRLHQLLVETDAVVFILSPTSAASEICRWEVDTALGLAKRILPVLCRPLEGAEPHPHLKALNYIFFYPEKASPDSGFGKGLATLIDALSQDVDWLRDHTRLTEIAVRWATREGVEAGDLLLRGSELAHFRDWRARRPATAPPLTPAQTRFLDASEAEEWREADEARRQIEAMRKAQEERQTALDAAGVAQAARERATAKLIRRTIAGIAAAVVLTTVALVAAGLAYRYARETEAALARTLAEQRLQDRMLQFVENRAPPAPPYDYATLARRYEGQEPDHVGTDFDGSHFYGAFRIRSGPNMAEYLAFLARFPPLRPFWQALDNAGGVAAATRRAPAFEATWQKLARDPVRGATFAESQQVFIRRIDYERLRRRFARPVAEGNAPAAAGLGLDVCARSLALQAAVFSIAVQYGPSTSLPVRAMAGVAMPAALSDRAILERLYAERADVEHYFPDLGSARYVNLVQTRIRWEEEDALYILEMVGTPGRCV